MQLGLGYFPMGNCELSYRHNEIALLIERVTKISSINMELIEELMNKK